MIVSCTYLWISINRSLLSVRVSASSECWWAFGTPADAGIRDPDGAASWSEWASRWGSWARNHQQRCSRDKHTRIVRVRFRTQEWKACVEALAWHQRGVCAQSRAPPGWRSFLGLFARKARLAYRAADRDIRRVAMGLHSLWSQGSLVADIRRFESEDQCDTVAFTNPSCRFVGKP